MQVVLLSLSFSTALRGRVRAAGASRTFAREAGKTSLRNMVLVGTEGAHCAGGEQEPLGRQRRQSYMPASLAVRGRTNAKSGPDCHHTMRNGSQRTRIPLSTRPLACGNLSPQVGRIARSTRRSRCRRLHRQHSSCKLLATALRVAPRSSAESAKASAFPHCQRWSCVCPASVTIRIAAKERASASSPGRPAAVPPPGLRAWPWREKCETHDVGTATRPCYPRLGTVLEPSIASRLQCGAAAIRQRWETPLKGP